MLFAPLMSKLEVYKVQALKTCLFNFNLEEHFQFMNTKWWLVL